MYLSIHLPVHFPDAHDQPAQRAQVRVAVVHFFVENDAVEPFARRIGQQFFRQRDVFLAGKAEAVNDFADFVFGGLDAFGNFHFLLARQQRHLSHLLEIHPHRVIENVQPVGVFLLGFGGFDAVHLRLIHDFDFETAKFGENSIQLFRFNRVFRQRFADVVVGQMPLFLREADEFLDFFRKFRVGISLRRAVERRGRSRMESPVSEHRAVGPSFLQGRIRLGFPNLRF